MMIIFPPCGPAPEDSVTPGEAIDLLAGVQTNDPLDPLAYDVTADDMDAANVRLFEALVDGSVTGVVNLHDGSCRRVPADWVHCFRSLVETNLGERWRVDVRIARLPDTIEMRRGKRAPDEVLARPWFLSRAAIEGLQTPPEGVRWPEDLKLVAKMRALVGSRKQRSLRAAALSLAKDAPGEHLQIRACLRAMRESLATIVG